MRARGVGALAVLLATGLTACLSDDVNQQIARPPGKDPPVTLAGNGILPEKGRAQLRDDWLEQRLDTVVPALMRREGIDMWVLMAREYNEDPVLATMLPATWLSARRRTILVFFDRGPGQNQGQGIERLAVARYAVGDGLFAAAWDKDAQPDQWARLSDLIVERNPSRIGVNVSPTFALADGLSSSERDALLAALPGRFRGRLCSAENLCIGWLETRIDTEMEAYPLLCRLAHGIIAEGFSTDVIQPGRTTTADLEWWYRDRIRELQLDTWFHPSVSAQNADGLAHTGTFAAEPGPTLIRRGDLLHVDLGISYLGLNTDTQQHAYVLREGETRAPAELTAALSVGNRAQDILMGHFYEGRTGNEILAASLGQARAEGLRAKIYTHPLGYHGHGAGPTIGMWDRQDGVPGRGDYPLHADTVHSIELGVTVEVPSWGGEIQIMLEEDAFFDGEAVHWIDGRQTALILIGDG